jgi:hypothetical protein
MESHTEAHGGGKVRRAKTAMDQIEDLLRKTVENGATPAEEASSVQLAYQLSRSGKDVDQDEVKKLIEAIGGEGPRYAITDDGFLVPASAVKTVKVEGTGRTPGRIRTICEAMLLEGKAAADIIAEVKRQIPEAMTTPGCVSWYKSKMVKRGQLPRRGAAPASA